MSLKYEVCRWRFGLEYFRHGESHKDDGPAVIWKNGDLYWWQYGDGHLSAILNMKKHESKISSM